MRHKICSNADFFFTGFSTYGINGKELVFIDPPSIIIGSHKFLLWSVCDHFFYLEVYVCEK